MGHSCPRHLIPRIQMNESRKRAVSSDVNTLVMYRIILSLLFLATIPSQLHAQQWYKGNTHTHSLWSDGNDFPEMITKWYKDRGYHFLALSDHNTLHQGERWHTESAIRKRQKALGLTAIDKYRKIFGGQWVESRKNADGEPEIRLRRLEEYRSKFEEADKFILMQAEEISAEFEKAPIHLNALNLDEVIQPIKAESYAEVMRANLRAIADQEKRLGKPMIVHLNHPNFRWALTPEIIAEVVEERFFEIYNGHPAINWEGDETRPSHEQIWDIVNTLRIAKMKAPPLYGVGTDDSHHYHGEESSPGRGFIMVKAEKLEANALVDAMKKGDFYASSGVILEDVQIRDGALMIRIKPETGVTYTTRILGTLKGYDATTKTVSTPPDSKDPHATRLVYSSDVGKTLAEIHGTEIIWKPNGNELYFRASISSSKDHPNPSYPDQKEMAWTQPMGW